MTLLRRSSVCISHLISFGGPHGIEAVAMHCTRVQARIDSYEAITVLGKGGIWFVARDVSVLLVLAEAWVDHTVL